MANLVGVCSWWYDVSFWTSKHPRIEEYTDARDLYSNVDPGTTYDFWLNMNFGEKKSRPRILKVVRWKFVKDFWCSCSVNHILLGLEFAFHTFSASWARGLKSTSNVDVRPLCMWSFQTMIDTTISANSWPHIPLPAFLFMLGDLMSIHQ